MDIYFKRTVLDELPEEGGDLVFDEHIRGWHEEVFTAKNNGVEGYRYFSNTPIMGVGNSYYDNSAGWLEDVLEACNIYSEQEEEIDDDDTCIFWRQLEDGTWELIEVGKATGT